MGLVAGLVNTLRPCSSPRGARIRPPRLVLGIPRSAQAVLLVGSVLGARRQLCPRRPSGSCTRAEVRAISFATPGEYRLQPSASFQFSYEIDSLLVALLFPGTSSVAYQQHRDQLLHPIELRLPTNAINSDRCSPFHAPSVDHTFKETRRLEFTQDCSASGSGPSPHFP